MTAFGSTLRFQPNASDTSFDPVAIAGSLLPLLAKHADEAERAGQIPAPVLTALKQSGLLRMVAPKRFGGFGCDVITHMRTIAELAKACAGSAWAFGLLSGVTGNAASLPEPIRSQLFNSGDELFCSASGLTGIAKPSGSNYIIDGSWAYSSGCMHADWALNGVIIYDDSGKIVDTGFALIPLKDNPAVHIDITWHVLGVKASGSNTIVAQGLEVPGSLILRASQVPSSAVMLSLPELEPRERLPLEPIFPLGVLSPTLGSAMAMRDHVQSLMTRKKIVGWDYPSQADSHSFVQQFGQASMEIDSAWLHIERAAGMLDDKAQQTPLSGYDKAQIQADAGYAMQLLRQAGERLMDIAGPSAFADNNPLQRFWRDLSIASRHSALQSRLSLELYGRAKLGKPSNILLISDISDTPQ